MEEVDKEEKKDNFDIKDIDKVVAEVNQL